MKIRYYYRYICFFIVLRHFCFAKVDKSSPIFFILWDTLCSNTFEQIWHELYGGLYRKNTLVIALVDSHPALLHWSEKESLISQPQLFFPSCLEWSGAVREAGSSCLPLSSAVMLDMSRFILYYMSDNYLLQGII